MLEILLNSNSYMKIYNLINKKVANLDKFLIYCVLFWKLIIVSKIYYIEILICLVNWTINEVNFFNNKKSNQEGIYKYYPEKYLYKFWLLYELFKFVYDSICLIVFYFWNTTTNFNFLFDISELTPSKIYEIRNTLIFEYLILIFIFILNYKVKSEMWITNKELYNFIMNKRKLKIKIFFNLLQFMVFVFGAFNFNIFTNILNFIGLMFILIKKKENSKKILRNIIFLFILVLYWYIAIILIFNNNNLIFLNKYKIFLGLTFYTDSINSKFSVTSIFTTTANILIFFGIFEVIILLISKVKLYNDIKDYYLFFRQNNGSMIMENDINHIDSYYKNYFCKKIVYIWNLKNKKLTEIYHLDKLNYIKVKILKKQLNLKKNTFLQNLIKLKKKIFNFINNNIFYIIVLIISILLLLEYYRNIFTLIILLLLIFIYFKINNNFIILKAYEFLNLILIISLTIFIFSNIKNNVIKIDYDNIALKLLGFEKKENNFDIIFIYINFFFIIYVLRKNKFWIIDKEYIKKVKWFELKFINKLFNYSNFLFIELYLLTLEKIKYIIMIVLFTLIFLEINWFSIINSLFLVFWILDNSLKYINNLTILFFIYLIIINIYVLLWNSNIFNKYDYINEFLGLRFENGNIFTVNIVIVIIVWIFNYFHYLNNNNKLITFIKNYKNLLLKNELKIKIEFIHKLKLRMIEIYKFLKIYFQIFFIFLNMQYFKVNIINLLQTISIIIFCLLYFYKISKYNLDIPLNQLNNMNRLVKFNIYFLIISIFIRIFIYLYINIFKINFFIDYINIIGGSTNDNNNIGVFYMVFELLNLKIIHNRIIKQFNLKIYLKKYNKNDKINIKNIFESKNTFDINYKIYNNLIFNFDDIKSNYFIKQNIFNSDFLMFFNFIYMIIFYIVLLALSYINVSLIYIILLLIIFISFFKSNKIFFKFVRKNNLIKLSFDEINNFFKNNLEYNSFKVNKDKNIDENETDLNIWGIQKKNKNYSVRNIFINIFNKKKSKLLINDSKNHYETVLKNFYVNIFPQFKLFLKNIYNKITYYCFIILILIHIIEIIEITSTKSKEYFENNKFLYEFIGLINKYSKFTYLLIMFLSCLGKHFINFYNIPEEIDIKFNNSEDNYKLNIFYFNLVEINMNILINFKNNLKTCLKKKFNFIVEDCSNLLEDPHDQEFLDMEGLDATKSIFSIRNLKNLFKDKIENEKNFFNLFKKKDFKRGNNKIETINRLKKKNIIDIENKIVHFYINKGNYLKALLTNGLLVVLEIIITDLILYNFLENNSYISIIYLVFFIIMVFFKSSGKKYLILILFNIITSIYEYIILCFNYERNIIIKIKDGPNFKPKNILEYILFLQKVENNSSYFNEITRLFNSNRLLIQPYVLLIIEVIVIVYCFWFYFIMNININENKYTYNFVRKKMNKININFKKFKHFGFKVINLFYINTYIYIFELASLSIWFLLNLRNEILNFIIRFIFIALSFVFFFIFKNNFELKLKSLKIFLYFLMFYNYLSICIKLITNHILNINKDTFDFEKYFGKSILIVATSFYYNIFLSFITNQHFEKIHKNLLKKKKQRDYILSILIRYM